MGFEKKSTKYKTNQILSHIGWKEPNLILIKCHLELPMMNSDPISNEMLKFFPNLRNKHTHNFSCQIINNLMMNR